MDLITGSLIALAAVVAGVYYFLLKSNKLKKIPGPKGYPIVGNAMQVDPARPHETLREWAKQYGDIMKISFFGEDVVVANSYKAITEMLVTKSNDFAGRPTSYRTKVFYSDKDIVFTDMSPKWSFMKKASMTGLKQVGDQVTELEVILERYLDELIQALTKQEGEIVDVRDEVATFVSNVTFTLVYGRGLTETESKDFLNVMQRITEYFNPTSEYAHLDKLPFLRGVWYKPYRQFMILTQDCREFFTKQLRMTLDQYNGEIRCALDGMIKEMKEPNTDKASQITFGNIDAAGINLVTAGVITTATSLYYIITLLSTNPDFQEEAYDHIIKAIGERPPTLNDRFSIPYIESMILELLRFMSNTPVSVPHKTIKNTTLGGYEIPKGTQVWAFLWNLHHDEKLWEEPWKFKPKRFLDEEGNLVKAVHPLRKQFYAFGAGRRVCVGESLAKHRMFLFVVSIIQKFRFVAPEGEKNNTDPRAFELAFTLRPPDCNVRIELRC